MGIAAIQNDFKTQDGTKIFAQYWKPADAPKALVIQSHGLGEHSGRYQHVADAFAAEGIALFAFDHRGHGKSDGKRGHIPDYESVMEELKLAMQEAQKLFPDTPKFLYGHSWGGNIALNFLLRENPNFKAAIVTDPWLHIPPVAALKETMGRFVNNFFPSLTQPNGLATNDLCTDAKVVQAYENDPLVHDKVSVRLFVSSDAAAKYALENAASLKIPVLLMHGKQDAITLLSGSEAFAKANPEFVTLKVWDKMCHEIHNEIGHEAVLKAMIEFMQSHL